MHEFESYTTNLCSGYERSQDIKPPPGLQLPPGAGELAILTV